jgi:hypothetical protein
MCKIIIVSDEYIYDATDAVFRVMYECRDRVKEVLLVEEVIAYFMKDLKGIRYGFFPKNIPTEIIMDWAMQDEDEPSRKVVDLAEYKSRIGD